MSATPAKSTSDWGRMRKMLPFLKGDRALYAIALLAAPASAVLMVVQPYLLKVAIDDYISVGDGAGLANAALWFLAAVLIAFVFESVYTLALSYGAMRTITRLRDAVYSHTLGLSHSYFDRVPTGRLLTRATSDVEALGETLTAGAITILLDVMLVVGILIAMLALDPWLTATLLLVAPVLAIALEGIRRVLRRLYLLVRTSLADLNAFTAERLNGIRVVQLYADETRTLAGFDKRLYHYRDTSIRTNVWDSLLYALVDGLSSVTMALMLWYGASDWFEGVATAGLLAAFIDYVAKLFQPIREFSSKLAVIQRAASALEKIFGLLDHDERIGAGERLASPEVQTVALRGVSFAYGDGPDVLDGVSITVRSGEVVALVGRTGSGKTTIGKLLIRAYDGYRGSIQLDGQELSHIDPTAVRAAIGMVHQDVQLFPGDIRLNLALGADLSDEALWTAIRRVHADRAVERLGGLDGRIEHQGGNLSVGEAQLLAFARTMAHDAPMVILDEATASVDTLTEATIQEATRAVLEQKTVLVVAHRLSTIVGADRIVMLDGGRVIESGSHAELLAQGGAYATLFHSQFEEPAAAGEAG